MITRNSTTNSAVRYFLDLKYMKPVVTQDIELEISYFIKPDTRVIDYVSVSIGQRKSKENKILHSDSIQRDLLIEIKFGIMMRSIFIKN